MLMLIKYFVFLFILLLEFDRVHSLYTIVIQVSQNKGSGSHSVNYMILHGLNGSSLVTNINTDAQGALNKSLLNDGSVLVLPNVFTNDYGNLSSIIFGNMGDSILLSSIGALDVIRSNWYNQTFANSDGFVAINSSITVIFPVNGNWNSWSSWSACTVPCGPGGLQIRQRKCNNPSPMNGGNPCLGANTNSQACDTIACPVDGVWLQWSSWSPCSQTCGSATKTRTRVCQAPTNGGNNCTGNNIDTEQCTGLPNCPVNGSWGNWTSWQSCSVTCGTGTKVRSRNCDSPAPQYSGIPCDNCVTRINGSCGIIDYSYSNCSLDPCISNINQITQQALSNALSLLNNTGNTTLSDKATMSIAFNVVNQVSSALMSQLSNSSKPIMVDTSAVTVGLANINPNSTAPVNMTSNNKGGISIPTMGNASVAGIFQFSALSSSVFFKNASTATSSGAILSLGVFNKTGIVAVPVNVNVPNQNGQTVNDQLKPFSFLANGKLVQTLNVESAQTLFQIMLNLKNVTNFTMWYSISGVLPNVSTDADAIVSVLTTTGTIYQIFRKLNIVVDFSGNPILKMSIPSEQMSAGSTILLEMFTVPTNNSNDTVTISVGIASITPRQWNPDQGVWQDSSAEIDYSSDISNVKFKSNFLGTFSAKIFIAPNMINFKDVFANFASLLAQSFVVLVVLIVLLIGYILLGVLMWRKDRKESKLLRYEPLLDNDPDHEYTYVLSFHTSDCSEAGTSSDVFISVLGKWGSANQRKVQDGYRENLFSTGTVCKFVMTTESALGDLIAMRVWLSPTGLTPAWHLEKIIIEDMQTKKMYIFMCDTWLAEDRFDGKTERVLLEIKRDQQFQELFYRFKVTGAMNKHVLMSLTRNTGSSQYTRLQKLSVFVAMFFLIMVTNAMFFGKDANLDAEANFQFNLGIISLSWFQIYTGIISVAITYPCIFLASEIFRRTKRWHRRWTEDEEMAMKKEFRLPKGFVFVGWFLLFLAIAVSTFFTFMYSLSWGNDKSNSWLQSFFLGIVGMVIFTDPIILLFIYILAKKLFGAISQDSELNIDNFIHDDMKEIIGAVQGKPDKEKLELIRVEKESSQKLSAVIRDTLSFTVYLLLLTALAYDVRDVNIYQQNVGLKKVFYNNFQINTYSDIYAWVNSILPQVYPTHFYNQSKRTGDSAKTINICDCLRLGPFRLRQIRVRRNTCVTSTLAQSAFGDLPCNDNSNLLVDDYGNYLLNWTSSSNTKISYNDTNWNQTYMSPTQSVINAFRYQNTSISGSFPFEGTFGVYEGGGYVAVLGMSQSQAAYVVKNLQANQWIDKYSRGVFFEGTVYNWNTNLFSTIQILFETPNSGGTMMFPYGIRTYRLYDYTPGKMIVLLTMQCLYMLIVVMSIYKEIKKIIKLGLKYFSDSWNKLELMNIILSICIIICTAIRISLTISAVTKLNTDKGSYVAFDNVDMWVETTCILMGVSCFVSIIRVLKYLGFNKFVSITQCTLSRSWEQLSSFAFILLFFLAAYVSIGQLLFSYNNVLFSDILKMVRTLFGSFLGMIKISDMFQTKPATDNLMYYFSWCFLSFFFLMSIVLAFLDDTYSKIVENKLYEYDKELVDYMWTTIIKMTNGIKNTFASSVPKSLLKKHVVAPVDMDDVDILMGSRESLRQFSKQRLNPSVRRKLAELNREELSESTYGKRKTDTGNEIYINPISFTDIHLATNDSQLFNNDTFYDQTPRSKSKVNSSIFGSHPASVIQPTRPMMKPVQKIEYLPQINQRPRRGSRNKPMVLKDGHTSKSQI